MRKEGITPAIVIAMAISASACVARPSTDDGFVSIFDGKTLEGWQAMPAGTASAWTVNDGMIVGNGGQSRGYLVFENREIADLELKFRYRFPGKGNSRWASRGK